MNGGLVLKDEAEVQSGKARPRVLITDVDADARSLVIDALGAEYRCEEAANVDRAHEKLSKAAFDLVLCDVNPSDESGWTLAQEVLARYPGTSVVFVTDKDDLRLARQAFELGAHGYLVKPYKQGQLLITAMNALKRSRLENAQRQNEQSLRVQLQTVIDHAPLRIYVKDRDYRYLAINRQACEPTGHSPAELIGRTIDEIASPDAAKLSRDGDRRVLEGGGGFQRKEEMVLGGQSRTLMTSKFPLLNAEGEVYAVCGISADITAIKQASDLREKLLVTQRDAIEGLRASRQETVERLARIIELRDTETGEHINRMALISAFLGQALGLDDEEVDALLIAAPMHDVGKIGIADEILLKPGGLTREERREMERHAILGHDLLADSQSAVLRLAASIAFTHHEHWDGSGYPRGIAGQAIPVEGRIAAVADVFDALLSDRPYRKAVSLDEALRVMEGGKGAHFEPEIVEVLLENLDDVLALRQ